MWTRGRGLALLRECAAPRPACSCSGHTYFVQRMPQRKQLLPYSVHTTFQYSGSIGKTHRLREVRSPAPLAPSSRPPSCPHGPSRLNDEAAVVSPLACAGLGGLARGKRARAGDAMGGRARVLHTDARLALVRSERPPGSDPTGQADGCEQPHAARAITAHAGDNLSRRILPRASRGAPSCLPSQPCAITKRRRPQGDTVSCSARPQSPAIDSLRCSPLPPNAIAVLSA